MATFDEMATFDDSIKQFNIPPTMQNSETYFELTDRIYSFIWFIKNYMEGKDINENYMDLQKTEIKPIEAYYNLVSEDGKSNVPSSTKTFFFKNFYKTTYVKGHRMNIPTKDQKKKINNWIIDSIIINDTEENCFVDENKFYKIIHINGTGTNYASFLSHGDVINKNAEVYENNRQLDSTAAIVRILQNMIAYYNKYYSNNYIYSKGGVKGSIIDKIILDTSIYKLKEKYKHIIEGHNTYTTNISYIPENSDNKSFILYSIVVNYPVCDVGEFMLYKYNSPYIRLTSCPNMVYHINDLPNLVGISDSFKAGAIYLFGPKLALLIQESELKFENDTNPMWKEPYYTTINKQNIKSFNKGIRITILTLQKYAATRRYMWSKDPDYASEVYKTDPKDIINELRDPYSLLPYTSEHISEFTKYQTENYKNDRRYVPNDINLKLIPYSIFVDYPQTPTELEKLQKEIKKQIDEEIVENWKWAMNVTMNPFKKIEEIYIELYALIQHTSEWTLNRPYQDIEKIEIKRIPEVEAILAPLIDKKEIEYEIEHPDEVEVKKQDVIFVEQINDVTLQPIRFLRIFKEKPKEKLRKFFIDNSKGGSRNKTVKKHKKKQFKKIITI